MISTEIIDWLRNSLPQLDYEKGEELKERIRQFNLVGTRYNCYRKPNNENLLQGDIIKQIKLIDYEKGEPKKFLTDAIIISNSCDINQDSKGDTLLLAPIDYHRNIIDAKTLDSMNNMTYSICFLNGSQIKNDIFVDFTLIQPYSRFEIEKRFEIDEKFRKNSLTDYGFMLFLSKLLIFVGRAENSSESLRVTGEQKVRNVFCIMFHKIFKFICK